MKNAIETKQYLLEFWGIQELKFTATYSKNRQGKGSFREIRKLDGSRCVFPDNSPVNIPVRPEEFDTYEGDKEYTIFAHVAPDGRRREINKEYLLYLDSRNKPPKLIQLAAKDHVRKIFREFNSAKGIAKETLIGSLKRLSSETNKKAETFIYELLQNADDYPDPVNKRVNIRFKIVDDYLIVIHNGEPFKSNNVRAICSVAAGDKEWDVNKIGFKGIGFKSIFKHSNYVWIHSGDFSFRFDEQYHKSRGDETFWQVIPVWTELDEVEAQVKTPDVLGAPVAFVIKPKEGKKRLVDYQNTLMDVFKDERVLLFLRSVSSLVFNSESNSFSVSKTMKHWEISELPEIDVPEEVRNGLNRLIREVGDDRVPVKYEDIQQTKITFATKKVDGKVTPTQNSHLYAYLPTDLDFGLPFLINGDFIPDGSREKLFWDIEWNQFLFKQAGYQFVKWLAEIYEQTKDYEVVKVIPNIDKLIEEELDLSKKAFLELFKEGMTDGVKNIAFVPDLHGRLNKLEDLLYDETGLYTILGEAKFKELTGLKHPVIHTNYSKPIISSLMKKHGLGNIYAVENIKLLIDQENFKKWLSVPENNLKFLELLNKNNWLEDLNDKKIYLSKNGQLWNSNEVYRNLGEDEDLLGWLNLNVLHPSLLTLKFVFPVKHYSPLSFISEYILTNKEAVDELLLAKENNLNFYQYLHRYYAEIPDSLLTNDKLLYFRVWGSKDEVIANLFDDELYLPSKKVLDVIEQECLPPDEILAIGKNLYAALPDRAFWLKFGVEELTEGNTQAFLERHFTSIAKEINKYYTISPQEQNREALLKLRKIGNRQLWEFVYQSLQYVAPANKKKVCAELTDLPIYTTEDKVQPLKNCYLSSDYTANTALENLVSNYDDLQVHFVSEGYLQNSELKKENWIHLFKECGVKTDKEDLLRSHIIPSIATIDADNLIATTQLIFQYRKALEDVLGAVNIKIKTVEGNWVEPSKAVIGSFYLGNDSISTLLSPIGLCNEISEEYSDKKHADWVIFFKMLGTKAYETELQIINYKLNRIVETTEKIEQATSVQLMKQLFELHKTGKVNDNSLNSLGALRLYNKYQDVLVKVEDCHFSTEYKPELDIDSALNDSSVDFLLSPVYLKENERKKELVSFFKKLGVSEQLEVIKEERMWRKDMNASYVHYIDRTHDYVRQNAPAYSHQHSATPYYLLSFQKHLDNAKISNFFWNKVLVLDSFKRVFESITYNCAFNRRFSVDNYVLWYIKNSSSVPALEGLCKKPSELFSVKFKSIVDDPSKLPGVDLTTVKVGDKTIEEIIGIQQQLPVGLLLNKVMKVEDISSLRESGVWDKLIEVLPSSTSPTDRAEIEKFIEEGRLPNQLKNWIPVKQVLRLGSGVNLGLGNSPHLIYDDLAPLGKLLGVKELLSDDFVPDYKEPRDEGFVEFIKGRLKYIAIAEDESDWETLAEAYSQAIQKYVFRKTNRISFCYNQVTPAIENTELTFYAEGNTVYYVGKWNGPRAVQIFHFLQTQFALRKVSVKTLQDLLLNEVDEILELFDERNIVYPSDWKPKVPSKPPVTPISEPASPNVVQPTAPRATMSQTDEEEKDTSEGETEAAEITPEPETSRSKFELTEKDVEELSRLLKKSLSDVQKQDQNLLALLRGIEEFRSMGYNVEETERSFETTYLDRFIDAVVSPDGKTYRVMCRSAVGGMLHISYSAWYNLGNANTLLYVLKDNNGAHEIFRTREELSKFNADSWILKLNGEDKLLEIEELFVGELALGAPLDILIRMRSSEEYESIFKNIYNMETERQKSDEKTSTNDNLDQF